MKKIIVGAVAVVAGLYLLPWSTVNWGKISWMPSQTVTVTGEAKTEVKNQIASFTAGVDVINNSKDDATKEINTKMAELVKAAKDFGIEAGDIKTQSLNYYQQEESYYDNGVQKYRKGQWRVSSSIEIVLRNVAKASDLAGVLAGSGANNVYGPNFSLDDTGEAENSLFGQAMEKARVKAELVAKASGRKLGKVLSVSEGSSANQPYVGYKGMAEGGGGGVPMEAGSGVVYKTLSVVFELK